MTIDANFPTDNDYGIPMLDPNRQAQAADLPIEPWGVSRSRTNKAGTIHFFTDDYRFTALWKHPNGPLKRSRAVNLVEANFSLHDTTPRAIAIWRTYQKRWLARYWQTIGNRDIFVDLNVARPLDDINMIGVPRGWSSYATRGYAARLDQLDIELEIALKHADKPAVLFLVYGGGRAVRDWCQAHAGQGAIWLPEAADTARGRYLDALDKIPATKTGKGKG